MAHMFPQKEDLSDIPYAEQCVYDALNELSDKFYIFHSVRWLKKNTNWPSAWKENDFVILNRNLGALVLEVKGGDVRYKDGVFLQTNTRTNEVAVLEPQKKKDPLSQAIDGAYHYRNLIGEIGRRPRAGEKSLDDRFPVETAVCFSGCEVKESIMDFPLAYRELGPAAMDINDLSDMSKAIYGIYDYYGSRDKVDISDEEFGKIVDSIARDFELVSAPEAKKNELEHAFIKLTNEQLGLLDYISEQRTATIQGVAGTGKTLIAKEAAFRFGNEGKRVLFLCFNRFLYSYLKHKYPYENVTYYNIHSLISEYGRGGDNLSDSEARAEALYKIDYDQLEFEDIIIDEAQDFNNKEILYFKDLAELKEGRFLVFYDKNQVVQTNEVPEWILNSECKLVLTKNCRNTYEIALTSYNVIDVELNQKIQMTNGDKTGLVFAKGDGLSKLTRILKTLTGDENRYEYSDIVILTLKTEEESILNDVYKLSGIPIEREQSNSAVLFTTAKKFKGLESKAIIIIDIDSSAFTNEKKKRDFYVACSRATLSLTLLICGDDSVVESIADSIGGPHFSAKGIIAMKTQADIIDP